MSIEGDIVQPTPEEKAQKIGADAAQGCITSFGYFGLLIAILFFYGFTLSKCWAWLILPMFPHTPRLNIAQSVAFMVISRLLVPISIFEGKAKFSNIAAPFVKATYLLAIAFVLRRFL